MFGDDQSRLQNFDQNKQSTTKRNSTTKSTNRQNKQKAKSMYVFDLAFFTFDAGSLNTLKNAYYAPTLKTGSKNNHEKGYFYCKRGYNFDHES